MPENLLFTVCCINFADVNNIFSLGPGLQRATLGSGTRFFIRKLYPFIYAFLFATCCELLQFFFITTEKTASGAKTPLFLCWFPPHLLTFVLNYG